MVPSQVCFWCREVEHLLSSHSHHGSRLLSLSQYMHVQIVYLLPISLCEWSSNVVILGSISVPNFTTMQYGINNLCMGVIHISCWNSRLIHLPGPWYLHCRGISRIDNITQNLWMKLIKWNMALNNPSLCRRFQNFDLLANAETYICRKFRIYNFHLLQITQNLGIFTQTMQNLTLEITQHSAKFCDGQK